MLFNSWQFAIFFLYTYSLYLLLNHKWQNRMLLLASCIFYGAWSWRFLFLMFVSITTDYFCGIKIYDSDDEKKRKYFLGLSILVNLAILGFFKYYNFFAVNLQHLFGLLGLNIHIRFLHIVLPVGISFYTFQAMSYAFDIYRRQLQPTRSFRDYALFVTYFPQLVAGPIMRARDLLPQVLSERKITLDRFYEGCYFIFWGLFQKIVVADNLAKIVDPIFAAAAPYNGMKVLVGLYAFAFQIYCDFAGYSNMAIGLGRLMGFDIMVNFNLPYFSTNPREFWQRWHISFSTWLRDYLYIPLGGNRKGTLVTYRNIIITMLLGGLWHGAAWTFVIWGAYQGLLLVIYRISQPFLQKVPSPKNAVMEKVWFFARVVIFFHLICLGWLIFRAHSMAQVFNMLESIFLSFTPVPDIGVLRIIFFCWILVIIELIQYLKNDSLAPLKLSAWFKGFFYFLVYYLFMIYGAEGGKAFIYFQF